MICAGYGGHSNISGCHGDSGGPLVCQNEETGRWTLRGTVSWGDHYCKGGPTYSVFVRISSYIDWIKCKMTSRPLQPSKFILSISSTVKKERSPTLNSSSINYEGALRLYCEVLIFNYQTAWLWFNQGELLLTQVTHSCSKYHWRRQESAPWPERKSTSQIMTIMLDPFTLQN